jgi:hypothetical protein
MLIAAPMREIAHVAGVSLSTVHDVLSDLEKDRFVSGTMGDRRLQRRSVLARRWVQDYSATLHVKTLLGAFEAEPNWWRTVDASTLASDQALWGGETAGEILGGHLRTARGVVYAPRLPSRLLIEHRLKRTTNPTARAMAEVRRIFWRADPGRPDLLPGAAPTVPALLVYADLVASNDPRLGEVALELREGDDELRRLFQDD